MYDIATSKKSAQSLNRACFCITVDREALFRALGNETGDPAFWASMAGTHPHLFSDVSVFVAADELSRMRSIVTAIEHIAALPPYRQAVLSQSPGIAAFDPGPLGALMGYDFHLSDEGPKLIEVNTNAGGAFLNMFLARAQSACCAEARRTPSIATSRALDPALVEMFESEWSRQRRKGRPDRIAIVDDSPSEQYLYPEFLLARHLFHEHGLETVITDARDLKYDDHRLWLGDRRVDLVYNRLVDFALEYPEHAVLREAYLDGATVLTPNPRTHALFADKRNLTLLSDPKRLREWGLDGGAIGVLTAGIPRTVLVHPEVADELWKERRHLFFKPVSGHGSKGTYRGDKLTTAVWSKISKGGYVAQFLVPPSDRTIEVDGMEAHLKADIRLYTYAGEVLLVAARLYRGQTTNFRTPGGGFAPVFEV